MEYSVDSGSAPSASVETPQPDECDNEDDASCSKLVDHNSNELEKPSHDCKDGEAEGCGESKDVVEQQEVHSQHTANPLSALPFSTQHNSQIAPLPPAPPPPPPVRPTLQPLSLAQIPTSTGSCKFSYVLRLKCP